MITYPELESRLFARARGGMKLGLHRMERALAALGNPHLRAPVLHVAGTNGKGSVCAFLDASCRAAGLRTGLFTSPHLEHFGERFRIDGVAASESEILDAWNAIAQAAPWAVEADGEDALTFFELVTLIAFVHFASHRVDVAVIEVGLGGRLDSTNVVRPLVTAITPLSLEHREFLGDDLASIAFEKAGILKPSVPAVTSRQEPEALASIERRALELGIELFVEGEHFDASPSKDASTSDDATTSVRSAAYASSLGWRITDLHPALRGPHQLGNLAVALQVLECAALRGLPITPEHARRGAAEVQWPGRLETVRRRPEVVLDGAHNPHAAHALARAIDDVFPKRRVLLVFALLQDKDVDAVTRLVANKAERIITTTVDSPRAVPAEVLATHVRRVNANVVAVGRVADAIEQAIAEASPEDVVLVAGSLLLVGEARALLRGGRSGGPRESLKPA